MPLFKYKVKDNSGQISNGVLASEDRRSAVHQLQKAGYYILDIRETREHPTESVNPLKLVGRWLLNPLFGGATTYDLAVFYRQFATMVKSGMSLAQAMTSLSRQGGNRRLRRIAVETMEHLQSGGHLSDAFARYPWMFPELHVNLIRAGETAGALDRILERIADYLEWEQSVRQKLRLVTFYPKILVLAVIFIPRLPVLILFGFGPYLRVTLGVLVPILIGVAAVWTVYRLLYQIAAFRYAIDCAKLAVPKLGKSVRMFALSKFYRVLSAMLGAGAPLSQAVRHAARASGNWFLSERLSTASPLVEQGRSLSDAFRQTRVLPQMAIDMLATGEQTGNVDGMLDKAAEYTESEAEVATLQSTVVAGVLLLLSIASYIGYFVLQFWLGHYSSILNQQ